MIYDMIYTCILTVYIIWNYICIYNINAARVFDNFWAIFAISRILCKEMAGICWVLLPVDDSAKAAQDAQAGQEIQALIDN